jgi:serine phosphatase RsbU (regulator of sigma subunit)
VLNPILREKGIRSLLGVPLVVGAQVLGVLHVGTLTARRFTLQDSDLLQLVADRIALAVQVQTSQKQRAAAAALQRSLAPAALPEIAGVEFAARYVPSGIGGVGGDWYDVFGLPSGSVCIVVGDVVGRGLPAAVAMGGLRSALRAYALDTEDPAELLDRLDRQVRYFEPDVMATVLCAVLAPARDQLRLSTAGHPPPVVSASPELPGAVLDLPADLPVGVADRPRRTTAMRLPAGTTLCIFTDGLVERRGESLTVGLERLRRSVFAGPAESVAAAVMSELVGDQLAGDDVAVLVVRRPDPTGAAPLDPQLPAAVPASRQSIPPRPPDSVPLPRPSGADTADLVAASGAPRLRPGRRRPVRASRGAPPAPRRRDRLGRSGV